MTTGRAASPTYARGRCAALGRARPVRHPARAGRTRALLRELGDPQLAVRGALVGGTNGKGSVLALADAALRAAGYRVGDDAQAAPRHVPRADLQIDGRPIDPATFARLVGEVLRRSPTGSRGATASRPSSSC